MVDRENVKKDAVKFSNNEGISSEENFNSLLGESISFPEICSLDSGSLEILSVVSSSENKGLHFELWARKRPVHGMGFPLKLLKSFEEESMYQTLLDRLDPNVYQEGIILRKNNGRFDRVMIYKEFDKAFQYRKIM